MSLVGWTDQGHFYHRLRSPGRPYRADCVGIFVPWVAASARWTGEREPCPRCFARKS